MNENIIPVELTITFIGIVVIMASLAIPIIGFYRKGWKGLLIGFVIAPILCAVIIFSASIGIFTYIEMKYKNERDSAMVTVRGVDVGHNSKDQLTWYLKDDEECILICNDVDDYHNLDFFDVIRLDNGSVGVEDRIVVKFDLKKKKVVATDLDKPMEVLHVNWDKVKAYLAKQPHHHF